jgi:hypothetical protein
MNLNQLIESIRKTYIYFFGFGLVLLAGILLYIFLDNPNGDQSFGTLTRPALKSVLSSEISVKSSSSFVGKVPRLLNVYSFENSEDFESFGSVFGFSTTPKTEKEKLVWTEGVKELSLDKKNLKFEFFHRTFLGQRTVSEEEAYQRATKFLATTEIVGQEIELSKEAAKYLGGSFELEETAFEKDANVFVFYIGAKLDGKSLVSELGSKTIYESWVSQDGNVIALKGHAKKLIFSEKSTYPTEHERTLRKDITDNQAKIVSLAVAVNPATSSDFSVTYQSAEVAYYLPSGELDFLQPVLLLGNGDFYSTNNVTALTEVLKEKTYQ